MNNVLAVATRELREGVRNRWVFSATLLLAVLALTLTFLGSAPTGAVSVHALDVVRDVVRDETAVARRTVAVVRDVASSGVGSNHKRLSRPSLVAINLETWSSSP